MPTPDPAVLQALFGHEPAEAVAFLESKGIRITWNWGEMLDAAHARAFTVAKAARMDVVRDIRSAVIDATREGKTLRQFQQELAPKLKEKGWWGRQIIVDPKGGAERVQLGSPRRLATIYRTNLQSAYIAGRAQMYAEAEGFPYLRYEAVMDAATRPSHAALHGEVYRKDDPIWASIYPPNGYNCRCDVRPLSDGQIKREGFSVSSSRGRIVERWADAGMDKRTGEVFRTRQTGIRTTGPDGQPIIMWTDPGFNSSPLAGHAFDEILARKASAALGDEAAFATVSKAVLAPGRMKAWRGFIENTTATGLVQQQTMTVGILPLAVARQAASVGAPVAPVLHVPDRLVVGKKPARHRESNDALSLNDWQDLPGRLVDAQWYRDTLTGNIVAYRPDSGIAVSFSRSGMADSAYRDSAAAEKIRLGTWESWRGIER